MDYIKEHIKAILEAAGADNRTAEIIVKVGNGNSKFVSTDVNSSGCVAKIAIGIASALYQLSLNAIKYGGFTEETEKEGVFMLLGEAITEIAMSIYAVNKEEQND